MVNDGIVRMRMRMMMLEVVVISASNQVWIALGTCEIPECASKHGAIINGFIHLLIMF